MARTRSSREVRPAVLQYLNALDEALESHRPGQQSRIATTEAELDHAHAALASKVASAATETQRVRTTRNVKDAEAAHVDAVHEAYLRLTPLLSDSSRLLHGWTDDRVETRIHRLRDAVAAAKAAARGDAPSVTADGLEDEDPATIQADAVTLELADSLRRVEQLQATLERLAVVLNGHSSVRNPVSQ